MFTFRNKLANLFEYKIIIKKKISTNYVFVGEYREGKESIYLFIFYVIYQILIYYYYYG